MGVVVKLSRRCLKIALGLLGDVLWHRFWKDLERFLEAKDGRRRFAFQHALRPTTRTSFRQLGLAEIESQINGSEATRIGREAL